MTWVTKWYGRKDISYTGITCPHDVTEIYGIDADNPLTTTYVYPVRVSLTSTGGCGSASCDRIHNDGSYDHSGTATGGALYLCPSNSLVANPDTEGLIPSTGTETLTLDGTGNFRSVVVAGHFFSFDLNIYDTDSGSYAGWTNTLNTATHKTWTWNESADHSDDTGCDWETSVVNTYDVTASDEITTAELIAAVVNTATVDDEEGSCVACFTYSADELAASYTSVHYKITNTSGTDTICVTWKIHTSDVDFLGGDEEGDCPIIGSPTTSDGEGAELAPGASYEFDLTIDPYGSPAAEWVDTFVATCGPC